jgi:hypothetical protein
MPCYAFDFCPFFALLRLPGHVVFETHGVLGIAVAA